MFSPVGGDEGHGSKDLEGPERDVAEVPDRRRDDVQPPAAVILSRGRRAAVTVDMTLAGRLLSSLAHPRAEPGRRRG